MSLSMTKPASPTNDSFKLFAIWLAALFLVVLGAKLWVAQLYGSPLPLWDQWYEADLFFRPWLEGHLTWKDYFSAYCEHRMFFIRLLDVSVIRLNGRWEPMLQMTVNAFICATYACGLAFCLWKVLGRKNGWFVCVLLAPFFALPYGGENTIWAISSLGNFVNIFTLVTLAGLVLAKPGGRWWWVGLASAIMGLFTVASGLLAPAAVGGLMILRAVKHHRIERGNLITLVLCLAVIGAGMALGVTAEVDRPLRAHSLMEFTSALARNLTWLFYDARGAAFFIFLPFVLLIAQYFRPGFQESRAAEFLLGLGLWSVLQSAAIAYGRANYGGTFPVSRYLDILNVFVIASLFASVLLAQSWQRGAHSSKFTLFLPLVFSAVIFFGLFRISQIVVDNLLLPTRMMNLVAEERVQTFMATGDKRELLEQPTVRPSPEMPLAVLSDPNLQTILPAVCLPPADAHVTGRLTAASQWLLRNSTGMLFCGLGLFACLIGYALVRSPLGLAWENLPACIAFLAILAALGFVWTKAPVKRETIERDLDNKLAAYFKSVNNPKRAAIFENKAGMLKNQ
jgi:hypothetical protein